MLGYASPNKASFLGAKVPPMDLNDKQFNLCSGNFKRCYILNH